MALYVIPLTALTLAVVTWREARRRLRGHAVRRWAAAP